MTALYGQPLLDCVMSEGSIAYHYQSYLGGSHFSPIRFLLVMSVEMQMLEQESWLTLTKI